MPTVKKTAQRQDVNDRMFIALGLSRLPRAEKRKTEAAIMDHMAKVVVETILVNLSDREISDFMRSLDSTPKAGAAKAKKFVAGIPGLDGKIEAAVCDEFALIRTLAGEKGR